MKKHIFTLTALLALASCATTDTKPSAAAVAPAPPLETEWATMEIHSQPEGAAIFDGWFRRQLGYTPLTINIKVVKGTNQLVDPCVFNAVAAGVGQRNQVASVWYAQAITFFMYNTEG